MVKIKTVAVVRPQQENSIEAIITHALDKGTPIEVMEKLFAMRNEEMARQAKAAYVSALSLFQQNCPVIKKTRKVLNKDGRTVRYQFAPIESIAEQIKKPLGMSELSYRWETKQEKGKVTAVCLVTHVLGHTESSEFTVDIDTEGFMTNPQKTASALTFAKRYSLCNALGISTGDEDTDATDVGKEPAAKSDKSKIIFLLRALKEKADTKEQIEKAVLKHAGLPLIGTDYKVIVERLEAFVKQQDYEDPAIR